MDEGEPIRIASGDYWVKVVEMLQQNWALLDHHPEDRVRVFFLTDHSRVFDEIEFASPDAAASALRRNGFRRFAEDPRLATFLLRPQPPFYPGQHPNGRIYSSGRFWR
jgi:hypothetical protein